MAHAATAGTVTGRAMDRPGCYVDDRDHRQLPHEVCGKLTIPECPPLTQSWCSERCLAHDPPFALAGVEAAHQCWCGDKLARPAQSAPRAECNVLCTGSEQESCGGNLRVW